MQVEQRHREAAAELGYPMGIRSIEQRRLTRKGERDDDPLVQAFARFEASLPPSAPVDVEKAADAILANLRDRKLLKYLFHEQPERCGAYGPVDAPLDLETQREIALSLASILAESTSNDCLLVAEGWQDEAGLADQGCRIPPNGWHCTRERGHDGPCAAHRVGRPVGAGWSPVPQGEATHDERLTNDELSALGLGVSEWAYKHLARGYAVSLSVREIKRLIAALSRAPAVTDLSGVGVG